MNLDKNFKRDFLYSLLSLILFPFTFYFAPSITTLGGLVDHITLHNEIPPQIIFFIFFSEVFKLTLIFILYPSTPTDPVTSATASKMISQNTKLPMSRRDRDRDSSSTKAGFKVRALELWKAFSGFLLACGLCHVFTVLLGAPFISNFVLTLQFSITLVSWSFAPLCLAIRPSHIVYQLPSISIWNVQIDSICRAKYRFIWTVVGAMGGAVLIPLDWDCPWQKWPITCTLSAAVAFVLVNLFCSIFLLYKLYFSRFLFSGKSGGNKVKYF